MQQLVALLVLTGVLCHSQKSNRDTIHDIFGDLFTKAPPPEEDPNSCTCVPYYLCKQDNTINEDGRGIVDISKNATSGSCSNYMELCCGSKNIVTQPITPNDVKKSGCGWRNPDGVGFRIIGDTDNEAKFGEFPWMIGVVQQEYVEGIEEPLTMYKCGGSLLHPHVVMTAAHCVNNRKKKKKFVVRTGEWDSRTSNEIYPHQDRNVKSITIHPNYYEGTVFNDVALLFLESPFDMTYPNVDVICLPPQGIVVPGGTRCFASGWGKDVYGKSGQYQVILKKVEVPMVDRSTCQTYLRRTRLGRYFVLDKSFVCAGGEEGKDACKGDGGGPLVCPIPGQKDRYQQAGIVAWGIGCGQKDVPASYANVALFRKWIDQQIAGSNLDVTTYNY